MMVAPKIIGLNLHRQEYAEKKSRGVRAYFDVEYAGITLTGCALRLNSHDQVKWHPPVDVLHPERRHGISLDRDLYDAVLSAALSAYHSFGGRGLANG